MIVARRLDNLDAARMPSKALTLMLPVAKLANTKRCKKHRKMTATLAHGYSFESTQRELPFEYPHDLVQMIFIFFAFL